MAVYTSFTVDFKSYWPEALVEHILYEYAHRLGFVKFSLYEVSYCISVKKTTNPL